MAQHGKREHKPPSCRQQEGDPCSHHGTDSDCIAKLNQQKGKHQRNCGTSDITQAIAQRGNTVHAVLCRHIDQKAVIIHARTVEPQCAKHIQHQKCLPVSSERQQSAADYAKQHKGGEEFLFHALEIAKRAHKWRQNRANQRTAGSRIAPEGCRIHIAHAILMGNFFKENGEDNCCNDGCKSRICPIIEHPAFFSFGIPFKHYLFPFCD